MSTPSDLSLKLRQRKEEEELEPERLAALRDEYVAAVESLYEQVEEWLADLRSQGLVEFRRERVSVEEHRLEPYEVECLVIEVPGDSIELRPAGSLVVGARGRIDVLARRGRRTATLVRVNGAWHVAERVPRLRTWPLDKAELEALLDRLLA